MLNSLFTLVFAAAALASPLDSSETNTGSVAPPTSVTIKNIVYGGTGCPQGTVGSFISPDRTTFTLIFDRFVASLGPGVPVTENRKNCQLNLELQYPGGFQYSISSTMYRGYVDVEKGVTGRQQATYYFSGQSNQISSGTNFVGPRAGDYATTDTMPLTSTIWSPCGVTTALNVNSQVRLTSTVSGASGVITDDSIDGKIEFQVGVQWQAC
ncbi:uncharacterized protein RAG0_03596 [Rhynchosporium agropyri]|uniref:Secreted protein n=3 Tax=Rhynchosporium TaxID=38037 RepID=A0A1E1MI12_RHYSE|nr:uncharacterized protein RAG0_03596 [Rhynchosporium agropyri]CZT07323.1 uncharacterized protein RCO7_07306 [Rhynchosporium commune]CZT48749.1 uncharacterized protein RSE6_09495 [Rhynchosporium secalis]